MYNKLRFRDDICIGPISKYEQILTKVNINTEAEVLIDLSAIIDTLSILDMINCNRLHRFITKAFMFFK